MGTQANSVNISTTGIVGNKGVPLNFFTATAVTQYNVLTGASTTSTLNNVPPSATSGVPLISQGAAAQPIFGTAVVAGGGTGVNTFANTSALIATGTTSTGNLQNIASVASGSVLTSAGTSTIPAWSSTPSVTSITLSSGTALSKYVEGTWTPVLAFGGSTTGFTYTTQKGHYTQIGNIVFVQCDITLSNKGSGTGNVTMSGLPVTSGNTSTTGISQFDIAMLTPITLTGVTTSGVQIDSAATTVTFLVFNDPTGGVANMTTTNTTFQNNTQMRWQGFYYTS